MPRIPIPERTDTDTQQSLQAVDREMRNLGVPVLTDRRSLNGLTEGRRALYVDNGTLYTYTRCGGKLYRQTWETV